MLKVIDYHVAGCQGSLGMSIGVLQLGSAFNGYLQVRLR
jgi:hypothetical protein